MIGPFSPADLDRLAARARAAAAVDARLLAEGDRLSPADLETELRAAAEDLARSLGRVAAAEATGRYGALCREARRRERGTDLRALARSKERGAA